MEQPVAGIEPHRPGVLPTGHPIGAAQQNQALDGLDRPPFPHEAMGQKIQQLGMAGPVALLAEIVHRAHQAFPEVVFPDAIDHYPSRQRIPRVDQPVGQLQAAASLRNGGLILPGQDLQEAARNLPAQVLVIPSQVDAHIAWIPVLAAHGESGGRHPVVQNLALTLHPGHRIPLLRPQESAEIFQAAAGTERGQQPAVAGSQRARGAQGFQEQVPVGSDQGIQ